MEIIAKGSERIALIIPAQLREFGTQFFTENSDALQVGAITRRSGDVIASHKHFPVNIQYSGPKQEFIHVIHGAVSVKFYDNNNQFITERVLRSGDSMLQISGGHGFEFKEDTSLIEVKQGPYINQATDKSSL